MRGENDFRMGPERAVLWLRLLFVDVERDAAERAIVEAGQNIFFVLQAAAAGGDHDRRAKRAGAVELREQLSIEHMPRIARQRQQADQDVGTPQERLELRFAMK